MANLDFKWALIILKFHFVVCKQNSSVDPQSEADLLFDPTLTPSSYIGPDQCESDLIISLRSRSKLPTSIRWIRYENSFFYPIEL